VSVERRDYAGYPDSFWLSNGDLELVVPPQVGPRILRCGRPGGANVFHNFAHAMGKSGEPVWQNRGGHRLWAAPETALSKSLDNGPIEVDAGDLTLTLRQPREAESGLQKEIRITLARRGCAATVLHRITNRNRWPIRFAPWALSVMRPGGTAITGFPPRFRHDERLLPTNPLVMWGYTDFSDPRWRFTRRFLLLRQDPAAAAPQKTGLFAENTWAAYWVEGELFVKRARAVLGAEYPDYNCSVEIFTNAAMLEIETLGPLATVEPGASIEHIEQWSLSRASDPTAATDEELAELFESGAGS
jgi:hypothetical protein